MASQKQENTDITKYHQCNEDLLWNGCYGSDTYYKKFVTPNSYSHPAKISFLLAERIFKHLEHLGLLKEGMTIVDFMAGSFRVPLLASLRGYNAIGIELEPHFCKMGIDNKKYAENKVGRKLNFEIVQGDSRQLSKILNKRYVGVVSPSYGLGEGLGHSGQPTQVVKDLNLQTRYGSSEGNIGNLQYKDVVGITSPLFADQNLRTESDQEWRDNAIKIGRLPKMGSACSDTVRYSNNPSNIGNLPYKEMVGVVSPPYQDAIVNFEDDGGQRRVERLRQAGFDRKNSGMIRSIETKSDINAYKGFSKGYSSNPQNIGNLKDKELVGITSSSYSEADDCISKGKIQEGYIKDSLMFKSISKWAKTSSQRFKDGSKKGNYASPEAIQKNIEKSLKGYQATQQDNLGNQQGQSYLSEMLKVYQEAYKSGMSVLVTVTKNSTRKGKLRRLDLNTAKLIEMAGFKIVDYHQAVLFTKYKNQTLEGDVKEKVRGRMSFFKRLSYEKGNMVADHEDIIIAVRNTIKEYEKNAKTNK